MRQLTKKPRTAGNAVAVDSKQSTGKTVEKLVVVKKPLESNGSTNGTNGNKKVTIIMGKAKTVAAPAVNKGNLMEEEMESAELAGVEEVDEVPQQDDSDFLTAEQLVKVKSKSEQVNTDHTKVYYRPFRKNFYVEVPELAEMTPEEVNEYREELESIKVRGKNCPKPIKSWAQCGVSVKILDILKRNGFEKPTPIQAQGVPIIMSGRDMIGIAKTGSGKTLAFLLPMFRHILDQPPLETDDGPIAIIMTPTRELATQIAKECRKFTRHLNINVVAVYGGTNISEQIAELKRGTEIIVCTPGRMIDMLAANNGRVTNLRRITYVVLDEADRMFDMGFEPQVTKILDNVRPDRQTVMFSATFPKKMEDLARKALIKPCEVAVGGRSVVCKDVEQHVVNIFF
jgi:ATP-dependent RNA helicase DDX46/PRP5